MAVTYKWHQEEAPEDQKQRTIIKAEPVPATSKETKFTLAQKEEELARAEQAVTDAKKRVADLTTEIATVKSALNIKEV